MHYICIVSIVLREAKWVGSCERYLPMGGIERGRRVVGRCGV